MSLKHHPDKNRAPGTSARYQAIRAAYEVLGDAGKRVAYRMGGAKMLAEIDGGRTEKGGDSEVEIEIPMAQLYTGHEYVQNLRRKIICRGCRESREPHCSTCTEQCANEKQLVNVRMGPMVFQQEQWVHSPEKCRWINEEILVTIEPGTRDGTKILYKAMGEQVPNMIPGDLNVKIKQGSHPHFVRKADTLYINVDLSLKEMLLGFERTVRHLDGHEVQIQASGPIQVNSVIRIGGEGMPKPNADADRGELVANLRLHMPTSLTPAQIKAIEQVL